MSDSTFCGKQTRNMSFYLLPPVSYQTQQKLKNDMERKKARQRQKEEDRELRSRQYSTVSSSASSGRTQSIRTTSVKSPSIFSRNRKPSIDKSIAESYDNGSMDQISNLDALSLNSDARSNYTTSTVSKKKEKFHSFNYNCNSDLNEIIQFNTKHRKSSSKSSAKSSSKSSIHSGNSDLTYKSKHPEINHDAFNVPNYQQLTPKSDDAYSYHDPHDKHNYNYSHRVEYSPNDAPSSLEDSLDQGDYEENEQDLRLTRVYSDVDSIFSTKPIPKSTKFYKS